MNILHINYTDLAGGRFTGFYMKDELDQNYDVNMAVWSKFSDSDKVHLLPPNNISLHFILNKLMQLLSRIGFDGLLGTSGWLLPNKDFFKKADIVHIHLIHGFSNFSILSLPFLGKKKPIVWTLHDPWALTGGCEHSFDCDKWKTGCSPLCPYPRCTSLFKRYTPYIHWRIKKWVYKRMKLTLVVSSEWMYEKVKISPLLNHLPCKLIPFGIDINKFKFKDNFNYKSHFNIPNFHKIIAFRNTGLKNDKFKGLKWLKQALEIYEPTTPTTLLIIENDEGFLDLKSKYNIINLGWIDGEKLVNVLSAADIFLMPSIQESFGLMAVEAMSCETPVITFDGTALKSIVSNSGIVVESKNSFALANAIKSLLENDNYRKVLSKASRDIIVDKFQYKFYVQNHIKLYNEILINNN